MSDLPNNKLNLGPHPQYPKSVKPGIPRLSQPKPGWKTYRIGELFEVINRPVSMDDETTYQLVTVKRARGGVCEREKLKGKQISVKSQFYVNSGDFLVSKRQIVHGACGFVPEALDGAIVSNEYAVLHCKDKLLPSFLNYIIHTPYFQQTCFHSSIGVHVEKMIFKLEDWFRWNINIPSLEQQKHIVELLDSISHKQSLLTMKINNFSKHKSALMQKIIAQKVIFRNREGVKFKPWTRKKIGDITQVFSGGTPPSTQKKFYGGDIPFIKSGEISNDKTTDFLTEAGLKNSSARLVKKGDLLYALYGANTGDLAISKINGAINQAILCIRTEENIHFIYFYLEHIKEQIKSKFIQGGQGNFSAKIVKNLDIWLPEKNEQELIARLLIAYDTKINCSTRLLKKLESFKQGLLLHIFE